METETRVFLSANDISKLLGVKLDRVYFAIGPANVKARARIARFRGYSVADAGTIRVALERWEGLRPKKTLKERYEDLGHRAQGLDAEAAGADS